MTTRPSTSGIRVTFVKSTNRWRQTRGTTVPNALGKAQPNGGGKTFAVGMLDGGEAVSFVSRKSHWPQYGGGVFVIGDLGLLVTASQTLYKSKTTSPSTRLFNGCCYDRDVAAALCLSIYVGWMPNYDSCHPARTDDKRNILQDVWAASSLVSGAMVGDIMWPNRSRQATKKELPQFQWSFCYFLQTKAPGRNLIW